jgi:precorrin-6B methylase 2
LYACDSFEGFDRDEWRKEADAGLTTSREDSFTSTSYDYVVRKLRALGLADRVKPVRGYFEQTLPTLTGPWCFAFIDCDLKDSLIFCAEQTWDKLESGGRIVFDDYHSEQYQAATEGVDQFVAQHRSQIANHAELRGMYYVEKA